MRIPFLLKLIFNRYFFQKLFAIVLLLMLVYALESFLVIFLITFLFSFLFLDISKTIHTKLRPLIGHIHRKKIREFLLRFFSLPLIITATYATFVVVVASLFYTLIPHMIEEGKELLVNAPEITAQVQGAIFELESSVKMDLGLNKAISNVFNPGSVETLVKNSIENLKNVGIFLTKLIIAMILSYVFLIDRAKIAAYLSDVKRGNFAFLYEEYQIIFGKIGKGFGLIFKAQAIIAFINALLTVVGLLLISLFHGGNAFPYIITLGVIVFIFGFIPVLGTFLSSVPILIIGYNYGGGNVILAILGMIAFIHAVEAYYLNPKIVSAYMELPVFLTFLVLLFSEHIFGFVGLLIGVPIFYILVDILKDVDHFVTNIRQASSALHETQDKTKESIVSDIRLSRSGQRGK